MLYSLFLINLFFLFSYNCLYFLLIPPPWILYSSHPRDIFVSRLNSVLTVTEHMSHQKQLPNSGIDRDIIHGLEGHRLMYYCDMRKWQHLYKIWHRSSQLADYITDIIMLNNMYKFSMEFMMMNASWVLSILTYVMQILTDLNISVSNNQEIL